MSRPKLVVVGNACRDITYHLDRLPKPGETLIAREVVSDLGGKGLNQAVAARRAGAEVNLVAVVGDDATAAAIRAILREEGMSDHGLIAREGISDESTLLLDPEGENLIVSNTRRAQALTPPQVEFELKSMLAGARLLLLQGNLSAETTFRAMELARAAQVRIAVNPSPFRDWFNIMPPVDIIIANQGEARALGEIHANIVVVTLGQKGCRLRVGGREIAVPAPKVHAIAAGGAGDVFAGTFIAEWLLSGEPERAARLAVIAASDKATRHGTLSAFPRQSVVDALRRGLL